MGSFGHASKGWPVVEVKAMGNAGAYFKLGAVAAADSLPWLVVTSLEGWLVQPVEWQSPWGQAASSGLKQPKALEFRAVPSGKPVGLVAYAASQAF